jgi:hypothetical protein
MAGREKNHPQQPSIAIQSIREPLPYSATVLHEARKMRIERMKVCMVSKLKKDCEGTIRGLTAEVWVYIDIVLAIKL